MFFLYVLCIYVCWCPTRFPYHMMFVSFNSTMTGATSGAGTVHPSGEPDFTSVCIVQSLVFFIVFCRSLLVFLSCFYWSLYFCHVSIGHCLFVMFLLVIVFLSCFYSSLSFLSCFYWSLYLTSNDYTRSIFKLLLC